MSNLNEYNLGLDFLSYQGQKQGGKYYSPGRVPITGWRTPFGGAYVGPDEYKKREGKYPPGYSKPSDPSNTVPAGSMNISPKGSTREKELEAQIKRDNAARKSKTEPAPAPTPAPAPAPTPAPAPKPKGLDLDTMRQYGGYGYDNTLTNTDNIYRQMKRKYKKESYDVVLEYLLSEGHAETLEEANYVMMQMTSEHLRDIVEEGRIGRSNPSINGKPIPNPPGHPKVDEPVSYSPSENADANKYREASQKAGRKIRADEPLPKK
tara:strand:+ start:5049 stop:5840 length:792 start_codon:yes stop_codon:yes gene_type:complete